MSLAVILSWVDDSNHFSLSVGKNKVTVLSCFAFDSMGVPSQWIMHKWIPWVRSLQTKIGSIWKRRLSCHRFQTGHHSQGWTGTQKTSTYLFRFANILFMSLLRIFEAVYCDLSCIFACELNTHTQRNKKRSLLTDFQTSPIPAVTRSLASPGIGLSDLSPPG